MLVSMKFGFHVSISGSVDRAVDRAVHLGCDTFQIFTRNPRRWKSRELRHEEIELFREKRKKEGLNPVFGHMPYLPNLATPRDDMYERSVQSLAEGLLRCEVLGIPYLVTHLGSHLGSGSIFGVRRVQAALDSVLGKDSGGVVLLLENTSGSSNGVGSDLGELGVILEGLRFGDRVGVCFDTCHGFAAGYDLRCVEAVGGVVGLIESAVGLDRVGLVHLNDCLGGLGSHVDRHEHVGLGGIGLEGFHALLRSPLGVKPMVLETPVDDRRSDADNLAVVRGLAAGL